MVETGFDVLVEQAGNLLAQERYQEAVQILEPCKSLFLGSLYLGKAQFYLGAFGEAKFNIGRAIELNQAQEKSEEFSRQLAILRVKCDLELSSDKKKVEAGVGAKYLPAHLGPTAAKKHEVTGSASVQVDLAYDWYQSMTHVFVSYKLTKCEGNPQSQVKVDITEKQVSLEHSGTGEVLAFVDLWNKVDPAESTTDFQSKKIEIKLKKATDFNWTGLEQSSLPVVAQTQQAAYPTSNKKAKNWDNINKEIDRDLAKEKPEGDSAMNDLFKQIYGRSDPETRRAMIKSYQTSGGTVLSTNWGEVAAKDYEGTDRPSAPDGQQWADEKDKNK